MWYYIDVYITISRCKNRPLSYNQEKFKTLTTLNLGSDSRIQTQLTGQIVTDVEVTHSVQLMDNLIGPNEPIRTELPTESKAIYLMLICWRNSSHRSIKAEHTHTHSHMHNDDRHTHTHSC